MRTWTIIIRGIYIEEIIYMVMDREYWCFYASPVLDFIVTTCKDSTSQYQDSIIDIHINDDVNTDQIIASNIKNAYFKTYKDDIFHLTPQVLYIKQYYGIFNGCQVVRRGT